MPFEAFDIALDAIRNLVPALEAISLRDPDLARQLRRAAASMALNLMEGRRRQGRDRLHHYRIAAGSADEVVAGLRVAEAFGSVDAAAIAPVLGRVDRVLAITWRLTH
jgi:four helix bundle protein